MCKKLTVEDLAQVAMRNNCKLLEVTTSLSIGAKKIKVIIQCENRHIVEMKYQNLKERRGCLECSNVNKGSKNKLNPKEVENTIVSNGYTLLSSFVTTAEKILLRCPQGHEYLVLWNSFKRGCRCLECYNISQSGKKSHSWKNGSRNLNSYIRQHIKKWKLDSAKNCEYKCVITGGKFHVIHHLYSFAEILQDAMRELKMPIYENIDSYTPEDLSIIIEQVLTEHYKHPLGVCLSKNTHVLFHNLYGLGNNTEEQFEEFKKAQEVLI